jgi:hypothetical protein
VSAVRNGQRVSLTLRALECSVGPGGRLSLHLRQLQATHGSDTGTENESRSGFEKSGPEGGSEGGSEWLDLRPGPGELGLGLSRDAAGLAVEVGHLRAALDGGALKRANYVLAPLLALSGPGPSTTTLSSSSSCPVGRPPNPSPDADQTAGAPCDSTPSMGSITLQVGTLELSCIHAGVQFQRLTLSKLALGRGPGSGPLTGSAQVTLQDSQPY